MIERALGIAGWMTRTELEWLSAQAKVHKCIVEMGCYQGQSTRVLAESTPGVVYAIDDWKGLRERWWVEITPQDERDSLWERFLGNTRDLIEADKIVPIVANHAELNTVELPKADMVFIDGDHTYDSVKRDILTWKRASPKAMLCGHDFNQPEVSQAVLELLPKVKTAAGLIWVA